MMALFRAEELPPKKIESKQHPWTKTIKELYSHRIKHAHNSIKNPKYPVKEEKKPDLDRVQFTVIGDRVTKEFNYCKNLVIGLHKHKWKNFDVPIIRDCSTVEWPEVWRDLKTRFRGSAVNCLTSSVAVFVNGKILGGEIELQQLLNSKYYYHFCLDYCNEGVAQFAKFIKSSGRPFAYMHVSIDDTHIGTLIFMLYADIVPYTCENFLRLCKETRGGYGGTPVHRIVQDGWIQCGGFGLKSTPLPCENFIIPFDRRGVLAMANDGRDVDCSTQFFVLLQPSPWMNHKYVAFGQLVEGATTLKKIERVTTWYESPSSKIILYRCGILNMECHDIMINRGANEYTDGHIENLNLFGNLLWEHILEIVFLKAQLREVDRLREQYGEDAEGRSGENATKKFEKDAEVSTVKEIEDKVRDEQDPYITFSISSTSLIVEPQRPYYIPLTDVPHPGDIDSDFDLRRFLKGDYCLECDLDANACKNPKKKAVDPSLLLMWSDSDSSSPIESEPMSLNSEDQKELDNYLKNNVDRVSFAGGIVKNIAKSTSKCTDIFSAEKRRASTLITDEKLRKMKLAAVDLKYREKRNTKVSIAAPGAYETDVHKEIKRRQTGFVNAEDLEKIRVFSRQHFGGGSDNDSSSSDDDDEDDDDDEWSDKPSVRIGPGVHDSGHIPRRIQRRPTGFIPASAIPRDEDDEDYEDDDDDVVEPEKHKTPKFHFSIEEDLEETVSTKRLMKRRPTGFVRPGTFPIDDDDDDEEEPALQPSFTPKSNAQKFHFATPESPEETVPSKALKQRRPTTFVRPGAFPIDDDDDDDNEDDNEEPAEPTTKPLQKSGPKFAEDDKPTPAKVPPTGSPMKRRATTYVRASDIPASEDTSEQEIRESVLARLYTEVNNDEPGPTLKNYKPIAELHRKKLLLTRSPSISTSEESIKERYQRSSLTLEDSFEKVANIQHGKTLERKLSSEYVQTIDKFETRFAYSIRSVEYAKKRPSITVSEYQRMNRQYREAMASEAAPV